MKASFSEVEYIPLEFQSAVQAGVPARTVDPPAPAASHRVFPLRAIPRAVPFIDVRDDGFQLRVSQIQLLAEQFPECLAQQHQSINPAFQQVDLFTGNNGPGTCLGQVHRSGFMDN